MIQVRLGQARWVVDGFWSLLSVSTVSPNFAPRVIIMSAGLASTPPTVTYKLPLATAAAIKVAGLAWSPTLEPTRTRLLGI
jgi:hypothetical protein